MINRMSVLVLLLAPSFVVLGCMNDPYENTKGVELKSSNAAVKTKTTKPIVAIPKQVDKKSSPTPGKNHPRPRPKQQPKPSDVLTDTNDLKMPPTKLGDQPSNSFGLGSLKLGELGSKKEDDDPTSLFMKSAQKTASAPKERQSDAANQKKNRPTSQPSSKQPSSKPATRLAKAPPKSLLKMPMLQKTTSSLDVPEVVAKVNHDLIGKFEFKKGLDHAKKMAKIPNISALPKSYQVQIYKRVLQHLIDQSLLYQQARQKGYKGESQQAKKMMELFLKAYKNPAKWNGMMKMSGLNKKQVLKLFKKQIILQEYMKELISQVTIREQDLKSQYKKQFGKKKANVSQILITSKDSSKVANVKKLLAEKDAVFSQIAKRHSEGMAASSGGSLGVISEGDMIAALDRHVFSMREGEVKGPIKSEQGIHFFKVNKVIRPPSFQMLKQRLFVRTRMIELEKLMKKKAKELRSEATIQVFPAWAK